MGLDQYLYREHTEGKKIIKEEICYWRKVNCLHRYFVAVAVNADKSLNDNCFDFIISRNSLIELKNIISAILSDSLEYDGQHYKTKDEMSEALLPTTEGFFFGSTEYDDWYYDDLIEVLKNINDVLRKYDDIHFVYSAWY